MEKYMDIRQSVIDAAQWLLANGYFGTKFGTAGNVSVRVKDRELMAITPSSRAYRDLRPEEICLLDFDQKLVDGEAVPSVEAAMHLAVYRHRPDVGAVVHSHQQYASVVSVIGRGIPPLFDEISLYLGTRIDLAPYGLSGSPELAANVARAVTNGSNAFILQNHGALCLGETLDKAVKNVEFLEKAAMVYVQALATGLPITELPQETVALFDALRQG